MKEQKCKQTHMRGELAKGKDWKRHRKLTADRPSWERGGSLPLRFLNINHPRTKHDMSNIKGNQRPKKRRESSSIPLQIKENDNTGCHLSPVRPADTKCEQSGDPGGKYQTLADSWVRAARGAVLGPPRWAVCLAVPHGPASRSGCWGHR